MTLIRDKNLQTGIAGSLAVHAVLLLLLTWGVGANAVHQWQRHAQDLAKAEPEVTLLFPDLIIPPGPLPPPEPPPKPALKPLIRTDQNSSVPKAPAKAAFVSDRNTVAAAQKAPAPDATVNMPSTDGISQRTNELANRDFRDGQLKPNATGGVTSLPQMLPPEPAAPTQVAKVEPRTTPVPKMLEEVDQDAARIEIKRPSVQIRERPDSVPAVTPDADSKAAGQPAQDAFSPQTRTSAVRGTISNRGENAVDAERTPMGAYMRGVTGAVEKKWHVYRMQKKDAVTFGSLRVRFFVKQNGAVEDVKIISDPRDADPRLAEFTLRAIKDAEIPPIPADVLPVLEGERVKIEYDVLIY